MTAKPVYRSISVEAPTDAPRVAVYEAATATARAGLRVVTAEAPWRLVVADDATPVELVEFTVAVVESPVDDGHRIVSVSAVVGPETAPGALDAMVADLTDRLGDWLDAIVSAAAAPDLGGADAAADPGR